MIYVTSWGISAVGRTNHAYLCPTPQRHPRRNGQLLGQIQQWLKREEILPNGALAQLVVRYIRIVEATGSTPVCSTPGNP